MGDATACFCGPAGRPCEKSVTVSEGSVSESTVSALERSNLYTSLYIEISLRARRFRVRAPRGGGCAVAGNSRVLDRGAAGRAAYKRARRDARARRFLVSRFANKL